MTAPVAKSRLCRPTPKDQPNRSLFQLGYEPPKSPRRLSAEADALEKLERARFAKARQAEVRGPRRRADANLKKFSWQ